MEAQELKDVFFELHENLRRQGPGTDAETLAAYERLADLPDQPAVADMGCGTGAAALLLAGKGATVRAFDQHEPFLEMLGGLAERAGLAERIAAENADIAAPPVEPESLDLVWSEAAAYSIGFDNALKTWRNLLKPGGYLVASELAFLTDSPSDAARDAWESVYAEIRPHSENMNALKAAGFVPLPEQPLSPDAWRNYYAPLRVRAAFKRRKYAAYPDAVALINAAEEEFALWEAHQDEVGYVYYSGRKA